MANSKPVQTEGFRQHQFKPQGKVPGNQPLSKRAIGVKLPLEVDRAVRALPNAAEWLRLVICQAAVEERLLGRDETQTEQNS